jgi:hypothetical protein
MNAAVEREVSDSYFFLSSLMCRPWGIRLKRERNEVCINPKGISTLVTSSAGLSIWVHSLSLVPALFSKYQPHRPTEIPFVTVNPGDDALASEYETTRDSWKSI